MELEIRYGQGAQCIELRDDRVLQVAKVPAGAPIEDLPAALEATLAAPVGPSLEEAVRPGDRVLVITVDATRPNPSGLLWPLVERIEAIGAKPEVMIGLGNHRQMTPEELTAFLGTDKVHQSDSRSPDQWSLGRTPHGVPVEVSPLLKEFDKRIAVGFIEPHYIAGFSGGRKMILPAVSSNRSITYNHFLTARYGTQLGKLDGNEIHEDMEAIALRVGVDFILNAVLNPDDSYQSLHCGDLVSAHRAGVRAAEGLYVHHVQEKADIVITSPGGAPYDVDMVQAKKALVPALEAVKPGGVAILVGQCPRNWGAFEADMELLRPETVLEKRQLIRDELESGTLERGWAPCSPGMLFASACYDRGVTVIAVTDMVQALEGTYLLAADHLTTAMLMAEELVGADATITVIPEGRRTICKTAVRGQ